MRDKIGMRGECKTDKREYLESEKRLQLFNDDNKRK